jgi:uncharacterized protein (TIGR00251 family)
VKNIQVKVIPRAKTNEVVERNGQLVVRVTAAPTDGKANDAVVKLLAKYLKVPVSRLSILRGGTSRQKVISVS